MKKHSLLKVLFVLCLMVVSTNTVAQGLDNIDVGGWSSYKPLNAESKRVFQEATQGMMGVKYTPKSVSTQLVRGENFKYKCKASPNYPGAKAFNSSVEIYKPLRGSAHITQIRNIP